VVGCEPLKLEEDIGLSEPVNDAVEKAVEIILETLAQSDGVSGAAKH
jgi:Ni,Fe-hydrogenase maturation factor